MIDYKSYDSVEDKLKAIKEAAAKKPAFNPYTAEIKILFSDRFMHYLEENKNDRICFNLIHDLYNWSGKIAPTYFNASLIDFGGTNDSITYVSHERIIKRFIEDTSIEKTKDNLTKWLNNKLSDNNFSKENGITVRAGKFAKVFGYSDVTCDQFFNNYSSYREQFDYEFELVKGDDIIKYYNRDNYTRDYGTANTPLWKSCMGFTLAMDQSCASNGVAAYSKRLRFYSLNEDCSLLILKRKGTSLINGRALIWKLSTGVIYMDRVYYSKQSEINLYRKYAIDNGIKYTHTDGSRPSVMYIDYNKEITEEFFKQTIDHYNNRKYLEAKVQLPYLDSWQHDTFSNKLIRK